MNLVVMQNRKAVTSSLVVAEIFEKDHKNVTRDIENIIESLLKIERTPKDLFYEGTYEHNQNKQLYKMYYMNRDGFTLLAMGYTGKKAMEFKMSYINAFDEMERQLIEMNRPSYEIINPIERAAKWIEEQKEKILLEEKIEEQKPKVLFAEAITASDDTIGIGAFAKILKQNGIDTGEKRLFSWLRDKGYLNKSGSDKNVPTQKAMNLGLFEINENVYFKKDKTTGISKTSKLTTKGQNYFLNQFLKFNILKGGE